MINNAMESLRRRGQRRATNGGPGGMPRMIGRWPEGMRFEDAVVPVEGFFRGQGREMCGIWPESSLSTGGRVAMLR